MKSMKDYCDYETCVALKELGYVGVSRYYYTQRDRKFHYDAYNKVYTVRAADAMGYVLAIYLYEAQKWLREEKDIHIEIDRIGCSTGYDWQVSIIEMEYNLCKSVINNNKSYEDALSEGIKEAVKILKEK